MSPLRRAYAELHLAVLLFGFTAILGKVITLTALVLVWWRVLLTAISLLPLVAVRTALRTLPRALPWRLAGIGTVVAVHWVTFYGAIKLSNASVTLVCMATTSFFAAFLEPWILRTPLRRLEIGLGLLIIPGMALIVGTLSSDMWWGVASGLLSALLAAIFSILNKQIVDRADTKVITLIEMSSAWLFLSLVLPVYLWYAPTTSFWPAGWDIPYLLVLALLCTTLAFILSLRALHHLSAFAATLTVNLEPVYGILLAALLLHEHQELTPGFYAGLVIILGAVLGYPVLRSRLEGKSLGV